MRRRSSPFFFLLSLLVFGPPARAQRLADLYSQVLRPTLDQQGTAENAGFRWDGLQFALKRGQMALAAPVEGRTVVAVFSGSGTLTVAPPNSVEKQQLQFLRGQDHLELDFTQAVFRFAQSRLFLQALADQVHFHAPGTNPELSAVLNERADIVAAEGSSEGVRVLATIEAPGAAPIAGALLQVELKTAAGWVEAVYDPQQAEPLRVHRLTSRPLYTGSALTRLTQWDPAIADAGATGVGALDASGNSTDTIEALMGTTQPGDTILTGFDEVWTEFASPGTPPVRPAWTLGAETVDTKLEAPTDLAGNLGLAATADVTLTATAAGGSGVLLELDSPYRVTAATVNGEAAAVLQPRDPGRVPDPGYAGGWVYLQLPHALAAGETAALRIAYNSPRIVQRRGPGNYNLLSLGWYPRDFFGPPDTRTALDLRFSVDHAYTVVATGERVRNERQGDRQITEWKTQQPVPRAGFTVGDYKESDLSVDAAGGSVQLAMFVNNRPDNVLDSINTAERNYGTTRGRGANCPGGVATLCGQQRAIGETLDARAGENHGLEEVANALRFLTAYFGPFPFPGLNVTGSPIVDTDSQPVSNMIWERVAPPSETPARDGPNWPTLFSISNLFFLDDTQLHVLNSGNNGTRNIPGGGQAPTNGLETGTDVNFQRELMELLPAHEAAHQWWGGSVGWATPRDQWLSEGLANGSALLYEENRFGIQNAQDTLKHWRSELTHADLYGRVPINDGALWLGPRLATTADPMGYEIVTYDKGGYVLYMLRQLLRDPRQPNPDADFIAMMRDFAATWAGRNPSTRDFQLCVEKHMTPAMDLDGNRSMDWFFADYVYSTGLPTLDFKSAIAPGTNGQSTVTLTIANPGNWHGLLPVYFFENPATFMRAEVHITRAQETVAMKLPFTPTRVDANHFLDMLAQVNQ